MSKHDGGQAFPKVERLLDRDPGGRVFYVDSTSGMTLRDYFAAQAIIGICASGFGTAEWAAKRADEVADAMIAEREKE